MSQFCLSRYLPDVHLHQHTVIQDGNLECLSSVYQGICQMFTYTNIPLYRMVILCLSSVYQGICQMFTYTNIPLYRMVILSVSQFCLSRYLPDVHLHQHTVIQDGNLVSQFCLSRYLPDVHLHQHTVIQDGNLEWSQFCLSRYLPDVHLHQHTVIQDGNLVSQFCLSRYLPDVHLHQHTVIQDGNLECLSSVYQGICQMFTYTNIPLYRMVILSVSQFCLSRYLPDVHLHQHTVIQDGNLECVSVLSIKVSARCSLTPTYRYTGW